MTELDRKAQWEQARAAYKAHVGAKPWGEDFDHGRNEHWRKWFDVERKLYLEMQAAFISARSAGEINERGQ